MSPVFACCVRIMNSILITAPIILRKKTKSPFSPRDREEFLPKAAFPHEKLSKKHGVLSQLWTTIRSIFLKSDTSRYFFNRSDFFIEGMFFLPRREATRNRKFSTASRMQRRNSRHHTLCSDITGCLEIHYRRFDSGFFNISSPFGLYFIF